MTQPSDHLSAEHVTRGGSATDSSTRPGRIRRVLVATDHRFFCRPGGEVYAAFPPTTNYGFWLRYLNIFNEVTVLARVRDSIEEFPESSRADGPGVRFFPLPDYVGPWEYLRRLQTLKKLVKKGISIEDVFILRVPGSVAHLVGRILAEKGIPFGVEVIGDPWDLLSPGTTQTVLRSVARHLWASDMRHLCQKTCAASYVTRDTLQRRYPPGGHTWVTNASSLELGEGLAERQALEARLVRISRKSSKLPLENEPWCVGFVGVLNNLRKGPDILIEAIALVLRRGARLRLEIVGEGECRGLLQRKSIKLGVHDRVKWLGQVMPGRGVLEFLDEMDLFVLPSRQEGLPRAMIEAMARGCPCIGSNVGGIPELLPEEDMVPSDDVSALAGKIDEVLSSPDRLIRMAWRNWETAKGYHSDVLAERRNAFYSQVRRVAEQHFTRAR